MTNTLQVQVSSFEFQVEFNVKFNVELDAKLNVTVEKATPTNACSTFQQGAGQRSLDMTAFGSSAMSSSSWPPSASTLILRTISKRSLNRWISSPDLTDVDTYVT